MINLIKSYIGKKPYSDEIKILMDSILKYPKLIGGSNNFDTQLMSITKGKILPNVGLRACYYLPISTRKLEV